MNYIWACLHWLGLHWWYEDGVVTRDGRTLINIRWCLLCSEVQQLERNYNRRIGHWYHWVTEWVPLLADQPQEGK